MDNLKIIFKILTPYAFLWYNNCIKEQRWKIKRNILRH